MIKNLVLCLCSLMMGCQNWQYDECVCVRESPSFNDEHPQNFPEQTLTEKSQEISYKPESDQPENARLEDIAEAIPKHETEKASETKTVPLAQTALPLDALSEKSSAKETSQNTTSLIAIDECVNINQDDIPKLITLPGVGSGKAKAIIQAREKRPFKRKKDITRVKGIGIQTYKKMSDRICEI